MEQITNKSITKESDDKTSEVEKINRALKKNKKVHNCLMYTQITLVILLLIALNLYFKDLYKEIYVVTKEVINKNDFSTYLMTFCLNTLFQMLFVPGISFFIIYIGFITKSYLYTMLLVYPSTLVIAIITYFLTKFTIRRCLFAFLSEKWFFKTFYDESSKCPLKTSVMLRILLIPATYKNYLISLMKINFWYYIIPAIVHYWPYYSIYALLGIFLSDIGDVLNGNIPNQNTKVYYFFLCFTGILIFLSVLIIIYFSILTCRVYREYKNKKYAIEKNEQLLSEKF